ncbi:porin family protein [Jiulongibacter sp. NS-SX5]|uniref:porin family protein n=1 Tax=Jiulongibacter sp. NS-SX5 TaxID=3463854 RepID=UPI00405A29FC
MRSLLIVCLISIAVSTVGQEIQNDDTEEGLEAIPVELDEDENDDYLGNELKVSVGLRGGFSKTRINTPGGDVVRVSESGTPVIVNGTVARDQLISNSAFGNGFQGAVFVRFAKGSFYVQPELAYASKGGKFDFIDRNGELLNRVNATFNAIDMPVLLGVRFRDARIFGGPVVSYALNQGSEFNQGLAPYTLPNFETDFFNRPVVNSVFGLGFEFKSFFFDLRYEGGISNYAETEIGPANSPKEFFYKTDQFIFSIGFIK